MIIMPKYILGIDIGGTKIQTGLVNNQLKVVDSQQHLIRRRTKKQTLDSIYQSISNYNTNNIKAIGISTTGLVEAERGILIKSPNLPKSFYRVPLVKMIRQKTKKPVYIENDGNCIALAEAVVGEGRKEKVVFGLTLGTGVGGGLVIDKKLYTGAAGICEYGHIFITEDKQKCNCGLTGHLESYVCGDGISRTYKKITDGNQRSSYEIIEAANKGELKAKKTLAKTAHYLAMGLANAINSFNPNIIVIGGGLSKIKLITGPAIKNLPRYVSAYNYKQTKIKISRLGYDAGILGAALLTRYNI